MDLRLLGSSCLAVRVQQGQRMTPTDSASGGMAAFADYFRRVGELA